MQDKPGYFAIIPSDVRYDDQLKANEKLLYGEITALANKHGYCWSENRYFAELYKVKKGTVSGWISNLEDKGYIRTELIYQPNSKQVSQRKIYLNSTGYNEKIGEGMREKSKEELNNTSINNTSINKDRTVIPYKKIIDYLNTKANKRFSVTNKYKGMINARIKEGYTEDDFYTVIDKKILDWHEGLIFGNGKPATNYLKPSTLFSEKFGDYLNEEITNEQNGNSSMKDILNDVWEG